MKRDIKMERSGNSGTYVVLANNFNIGSYDRRTGVLSVRSVNLDEIQDLLVLIREENQHA